MRRTLALLAIVAAAILAGGWVFAATQHLPFGYGAYWAVTTASTVGYGDVTPKTDAGRIVAVVLMLTTIPMLAAAFSRLSAMHVSRRVKADTAAMHDELKEHVRGLLDEHHRKIHRLLTGESGERLHDPERNGTL